MTEAEEAAKQFLKNEERLWDMAAMTICSSLVNSQPFHFQFEKEIIAEISYNLADVLMAERRKRLSK